MGYRIVHICDNCSYEAMITGGKDFGFFIITETLECPGCQTLADYEVAPTPGYDETLFGPIREPRCDQCDQMELKPWKLRVTARAAITPCVQLPTWAPSTGINSISRRARSSGRHRL